MRKKVKEEQDKGEKQKGSRQSTFDSVSCSPANRMGRSRPHPLAPPAVLHTLAPPLVCVPFGGPGPLGRGYIHCSGEAS